jgi:RNA polymerase sigma factor (sigma-70 family)
VADRPLRNVIDHLRRTAGAEEAHAATDAELLERFAVGHDQDAFELLVWRHSRMVLGVCRGVLRDEHEAEDAFQAAFLILAKKAAHISRRESVSGWLYRVAYRVGLQARAVALKRAAREQSVQGVPIPSGENDPSTEAAGRELRQALDEELTRLPGKYRTVLVLRCLAGKSSEETARELGCPVGTVESRLTRAREKLRVRLNRKGFAVPAAAIAAGLSAEAMAVGVTRQWVSEVAKTAALVAAGRAAVDVVSPTVAALMEGVLRAMLLTKAKTWTAVLLVLSTSTLACAMMARGQANQEAERAQATDNKKEANRPAATPPRADYRIREGDRLYIEAQRILPDAPIRGIFQVDGGTVALGLAYGRVYVDGQTVDEAAASIQRYLQQNVVRAPQVVVRRSQGADDRIQPGDLLQIKASNVLPDEPIDGVFRVEDRGTVALGLTYGRVQVKGQTLEEAQATILRHLQQNVVKTANVDLVTRRNPVTDLPLLVRTLEERVKLLEEEVTSLRAAAKRLQK